MTVGNPIWRALERIRNAKMTPSDRELLRPAFAALDDAKEIALPHRIVARIRDIDARQSKPKEA